MPSTPRSKATVYVEIDPPLRERLFEVARLYRTTAAAVVETALYRHFTNLPPLPPPLPPLPEPEPPRPRGRPKKESPNKS